ncbi:conserved Plasmodium protein, unknown function [Plasmodium knowlesi strain H]|uniref:Inner membrane complex protein 1l n=3 Tax=Plasmodium knowlesi TaxID=5850 RepID=A0A5E7X7Y9_PLAKH|nr:inner membrane complex protein 1l, putative [Plasmodium knowlesi strain H]OTN67725.1 Uncharacterized protein PKNOH_S05384900 [Plasmodium knowlesi]CAA9990436.1 inner membrane complex protein 1l, putative [Plasmodium knowlesi strain H]SBO19642.1 conserved Plasmodium protein, unknown function [Plasmodium knowlesi strain H]SBO22550.1 conserved Plasmodium protein, unknown function [Plasmodium knowlesi strain H]VVS79910.1 inner membrane complex protein 1l, putative [Plasmodium knowlesi strain H]
MVLKGENLCVNSPRRISYPGDGYNIQMGSPFYAGSVGELCHSNPVIRRRHLRASPLFGARRCRVHHFQRHAEVPVFRKAPKIVEVPEVREVTRFVDSVKVVDIPVEQVRIVPKLKIREIEKIRHVPGPVEYIDIEQEHIVHKPYTKVIEKIYEVPEVEDVQIEVPIYVPTPVGPPKDVYINVPLPYDVPQFCYKPDKQIAQGVPYPTFQRVLNNGSNFYAGEDAFDGYTSDVDSCKTEQREMYSADQTNPRATGTGSGANGEYYKRDYSKNETNLSGRYMGEESRNYYDYQDGGTHNGNENYNTYASNYRYDSAGNGIMHNENNLNSSEPFDKYYYSYSAYNDNRGRHTQEENYEDNKNYVYNNEFSEQPSSPTKRASAELIVKRSKKSFY